jgi:hypothetical protein
MEQPLKHEVKSHDRLYGLLFWGMVALLTAAMIAANIYLPFLGSTGPMDFSLR